MSLPFVLEGPAERAIAADPEWLAGVEWGKPRSGHPEGAVKFHIAEVLANLDRLDLSDVDRRRLRIAALVHDTFKFRVDRSKARIPPNEHGYLASRWLAARGEKDTALIALIELHDEGYRAWRAHEAGDDGRAWARIARIIERMGDAIGLFVAFYWADNRTGHKEPEQVGWFVARLNAACVDATEPSPS